MTDPVAQPPVPATAFSVNGLVELLRSTTTPCSRWSARSRSARPGRATRSSSTRCRCGTSTAHKKLLLNLDELGIRLDNVEGMAFGPRLRHGKQSLVLVSDNNFAPAQFTQFLLFAFDD